MGYVIIPCRIYNIYIYIYMYYTVDGSVSSFKCVCVYLTLYTYALCKVYIERQKDRLDT